MGERCLSRRLCWLWQWFQVCRLIQLIAEAYWPYKVIKLNFNLASFGGFSYLGIQYRARHIIIKATGWLNFSGRLIVPHILNWKWHWWAVIGAWGVLERIECSCFFYAQYQLFRFKLICSITATVDGLYLVNIPVR